MQSSSETPSTWPLQRIPVPRRVSLLCLGLLYAIYIGITCYIQLLAQYTPEKWFPPAAWLPSATDELINITFAFTVPVQLVLIGGFLMGICRLRPREIGLDLSKLPAAVILTLLIWAVTQVILVIVYGFAGQEIAINPEWKGGGWPRASGMWIGQLFGNTLLEEVIYRGFLLPQILLLMLIWLPKPRPGISIFLALVLSQVLFAVLHVFYNAHEPEGQWLLLSQFALGLLYAGVYLRTGNLFLAMGLHTLMNNPSPLLNDPYPAIRLGNGIPFVGLILVLMFGPWIVRRLNRSVNPQAKR
jgi:membrane protease YdiL (CAAX protease family)